MMITDMLSHVISGVIQIDVRLFSELFCIVKKISEPGSWQLPGPLFTKKTPSYQYRDSHYKPETVVRPSEVYNGDPYTHKTASS